MESGRGRDSAPNALWSDGDFSVDFQEQILDHVAHPIFVKDRQFRWVVLNQALCDMVGYPREELLGKTDYDFFPKAEADFFRQKDIEMFSTGAQVTIDEEPITDGQGRRHILSTTKVPLRAPSGEVTHLIGIIHDITRLKAAEEALRLANEDLERRVKERTAALEIAQEELVRKERLAVLGQLAGGLAHQIRNPLGAITNATYLLKRRLRAEPSSEVAHAIAIILEEAWHANRLISDLLDYGRVQPPRLRSVSALHLFKRVASAHTASPTLTVKIEAPEAPLLFIDEDQVADAFDNLFRNALDAMPDGGTLGLEARAVGTQMLLIVRDTGAGVPPEIRARLFEPLVTSKPLGRGLGLTTARALIENQGGTIISEETEKGACFVVTLPLADAANG